MVLCLISCEIQVNTTQETISRPGVAGKLTFALFRIGCLSLSGTKATILDEIGRYLHRSVKVFRLLGFLLCFVLDPGGLREAPGGPGKAHGQLWGGLPGAPSRGGVM